MPLERQGFVRLQTSAKDLAYALFYNLEMTRTYFANVLIGGLSRYAQDLIVAAATAATAAAVWCRWCHSHAVQHQTDEPKLLGWKQTDKQYCTTSSRLAYLNEEQRISSVVL